MLTAAGVDGFLLPYAAGSVSLTVSSIGYNSRTVSMNNRISSTSPRTEDQQIDDVVCGRLSESVTLTGSVSAISGKDIVSVLPTFRQLSKA